MNYWIMAIRPKTLFASISPVILGITIAFFYQHHINFPIAILTCLSAVSMQIASNLANDYLDFESGVDQKIRLGPVRVTQAGLITPNKMKKGLTATLIFSFLIGLYLMWTGGPVIIIIGFLSLYFAYGYTGGPFPLSHHGLGEFAAFIFFGIVAVSGTTYLQTHRFYNLSLILGMGPGFIAATILAINNLRDIKSDSDVNKKTLAVIIGENSQRKLCLALIFSSSLLPVIVASHYKLTFLYPVAFLSLIFIKNWLHIYSTPINQSLNQTLARTAQYLLLYCLMTSIGLILSHGHVL